jgi:hypothetical protein
VSKFELEEAPEKQESKPYSISYLKPETIKFVLKAKKSSHTVA